MGSGEPELVAVRQPAVELDDHELDEARERDGVALLDLRTGGCQPDDLDRVQIGNDVR